VVLNRKHVGAVLRRQGGRLQRCANAHLSKGGAGRDVALTIDFTIESSGRVLSAALRPASLEKGEFGVCLLQEVRKLRFPRHRDKTVSISFPLQFQAVGN
jgi:hypothetical protein